MPVVSKNFKTDNTLPQCNTNSRSGNNDNDKFSKLWSSFYEQSSLVINPKSKTNKNESTQNRNNQRKKHAEQVISIYDTISKLIFGLDESKKSISINHGMGALELIVALYESVNAKKLNECDPKLKDKVTTSLLRTIKTCVVRNPTGRKRCRSASIFGLLDGVLDDCLKKTSIDGEIGNLEDGLTTLAAICLGDDLNALQGALRLRHHVTRASDLYNKTEGDKGKKGNHDSLKQKITYLNALFDAVCKEQDDLIRKLGSSNENEDAGKAEKGNNKHGEGKSKKVAGLKKDGYDVQKPQKLMHFFDSVSKSEIEARKGDESKNPQQAERHFDEALQHLSWSLDALPPLLEPYRHHLLQRRASIRLTLQKYNESLDDINSILDSLPSQDDDKKGANAGAPTASAYRPSMETVIQAYKIRSEALYKLGRYDEAKVSASKGLILCPTDQGFKSLVEQMEKASIDAKP